MNKKQLIEEKYDGNDFIGFFGGRSHNGFFKQEYLSNFHKADIKIKTNTATYHFSSVEQFFMWYKAKLFNDIEIANLILSLDYDPKKAKQLGRKVKNYDDEMWSKKKETVMYLGLKAKFTQNKEFYKYLISTGNSILVEASPYDKYWGCGLSLSDKFNNPEGWPGENRLGFLLMKLREELKDEVIE